MTISTEMCDVVVTKSVKLHPAKMIKSGQFSSNTFDTKRKQVPNVKEKIGQGAKKGQLFCAKSDDKASQIGSDVNQGDIQGSDRGPKICNQSVRSNADVQSGTNSSLRGGKRVRSTEGIENPQNNRPRWISPVNAKQEFSLSKYEGKEILRYPRIYYIGQSAIKAGGSDKSGKPNKGFDDEEGYYRFSAHDHIAYRYGSPFLKCIVSISLDPHPPLSNGHRGALFQTLFLSPVI